MGSRPKLPSHYVTRDHSIPADVYRFLYNAQTMVQRYPALGGIFREGTGIQHDPYDRQARLFGFNFGLDFGALVNTKKSFPYTLVQREVVQLSYKILDFVEMKGQQCK